MVIHHLSGMVAVLNHTGSNVAVMAHDAEEGFFFNVSGWVRVADNDPIELADSLYK